MSELEGSAACGKQLGEHEHLALRIEATKNAPLRAPFCDLNLDPELLLHEPDEAGIEVVARELRLRSELLGRGLELREVIRVGLDHVPDLLAREVGRGAGPCHLVAVGEARREIVGARPRRLVRAVERQHSACGNGARDSHLPNVDRREVAFLEHGIGEGLRQIGNEARVLVGRERMHVHVEELRHANEKVRRQRPAVVLDEVQIAGRDRELLCELDLVEALATAQRANLRPVTGRVGSLTQRHGDTPGALLSLTRFAALQLVIDKPEPGFLRRMTSDVD